MSFSIFNENSLRKIAELLADAATHGELGEILQATGIAENGGTPKWQRILFALTSKQKQDQCGNNVGGFIQAMMEPVRYVNRNANFEDLRLKLNKILSFSGLQLGENGKLHPVSHVETLSEADEKAGQLKSELVRRKVHHDVLAFCRAELLEENYFHAILEATKSVADKLRVRTGLTNDGAALVDSIFNITRPLLALSALTTESEKSEQKGFGSMLKGMFGIFRNPTAHAPKIRKIYSEQETLDLLTLVSFLHRTIDVSIRTPFAVE